MGAGEFGLGVISGDSFGACSCILSGGVASDDPRDLVLRGCRVIGPVSLSAAVLRVEELECIVGEDVFTRRPMPGRVARRPGEPGIIGTCPVLRTEMDCGFTTVCTPPTGVPCEWVEVMGTEK